MNPDRRVIDDGQLDEALRTIAAASAPGDLPVRVLEAIQADVRGGWHRFWQPAIGVAAVGVVLLVMAAAWMNVSEGPQVAQGSRHMAQGSGPTAQGSETSAHGPGPMAHGSETSAHGAGRTAHGSELPLRTGAPAHSRTSAPSAPSAPLEVQADEIEPLDPLAPLTVAQLEMSELSERELQVHALHIPALEIASLER